MTTTTALVTKLELETVSVKTTVQMQTVLTTILLVLSMEFVVLHLEHVPLVHQTTTTKMLPVTKQEPGTVWVATMVQMPIVLMTTLLALSMELVVLVFDRVPLVQQASSISTKHVEHHKLGSVTEPITDPTQTAPSTINPVLAMEFVVLHLDLVM